MPPTFQALLFAAEVRAGVPIKIAFKVPGSGDLTLRAEGPDGAVVEVADLVRHTGGSDWQAPGEEWGGFWTFSAPGCWTVRADRTDGTRAALALRAG
ncbi:hypothetical protein ACTMSW_22255 [Micromonospora sp. BQ11]|uniref:hypothetical protein n=1 Tax=Micromonospora sp. BQ11 TaxID=3452212 RepID=UPI003F88E194